MDGIFHCFLIISPAFMGLFSRKSPQISLRSLALVGIIISSCSEDINQGIPAFPGRQWLNTTLHLNPFLKLHISPPLPMVLLSAVSTFRKY